MKLEAKMVPVTDPSLTLADVPVWTSCKVRRDGAESIRFHHPSGHAADIVHAGGIYVCFPASEYTVLEVLGPLPSGNDPPAEQPSPIEPVTLDKLPPWRWVKVEWEVVRSNGTGVRCHDGHGIVMMSGPRGELCRCVFSPETYIVIGPDRWDLKVEVIE